MNSTSTFPTSAFSSSSSSFSQSLPPPPLNNIEINNLSPPHPPISLSSSSQYDAVSRNSNEIVKGEGDGNNQDNTNNSNRNSSNSNGSGSILPGGLTTTSSHQSLFTNIFNNFIHGSTTIYRGMEMIGEVLVSLLGLDQSRYQYVIDGMTAEDWERAREVQKRREEEYARVSLI